jgi:aryl-alcohol dehydrogenase-like predicted oxidoreductase
VASVADALMSSRPRSRPEWAISARWQGSERCARGEVHADRCVPIEETLRALDDLVAAGKVRYVGFSDVQAWVAARAQTITHVGGWTPITALQLEYSLLERTPEGELLPMAEELGMGVLPRSGHRGGQLTGKYVRDGGAPASRTWERRGRSHPGSRRIRRHAPNPPSREIAQCLLGETELR